MLVLLGVLHVLTGVVNLGLSIMCAWNNGDSRVVALLGWVLAALSAFLIVAGVAEIVVGVQ